MLHLCDGRCRQNVIWTALTVASAPWKGDTTMQHDNAEDPWGFWEAEPTRQLNRTHVGARTHGETSMVPLVRIDRARSMPVTRHPNPLAARVCVMLGAMLLMVPIAVSLRHDRSPVVRAADNQSVETIAVAKIPPPPPTGETFAPETAAPTTVVATTVVATTTVPVTPAPIEVVATPAPSEPPTTAAPPKQTTPKTTQAPASPPPAAATQSAAKQSCGMTYTIAKGDAWSSIAARAKVSMKSLLAANGATTKTVLLPGKDICLPAGAVAPGPPITAAPATTQPATTQPPPPAASATTQPAPTTPPAAAAPTTTQPASPANTYSKAEATQIIRDIWPDDLENEAIRIATRESNLIPTVKSYCCYGLFQIYFSAHSTWLASIGVTNAAQLYDPRVNATAALSLYNRSGWAPWA